MSLIDKIDQHIFSKFYPNLFEGKYYLKFNHGVESLGFTRINDYFYEYAIKSKSSNSGERRYFLPFSKLIFNEGNQSFSSDYFKGLIGESLTRIILVEFMRKNKSNLNIKKFKFLKGNFHPENHDNILVKNQDYIASHMSRYNIKIVTDKKQLTEYDGLLEYTYDGNKKGLLICESKTGSFEYLKDATSEENKEKIKVRIVEPLKSLFPNYILDYVLVGNSENIFSNYEERELNTSIIKLHSFLSKSDIGVIPFYFFDSKSTIRNIANNLYEFYNIFSKLNNSDDILNSDFDQFYVETDNYLRLIKGKRIEKIFKKIDESILKQIYP